MSCIFSPVASLVAGFPTLSFSGSRHGSAAAAAFVPALAAARPSVPVRVGCAAGVDATVRAAFPAAAVFYVSGRGRGAFAARSARLVRVSGAAGGLLVAFPATPIPPAGCRVGRSFRGGGSGSWGSVALALGLGFPVLVWVPSVAAGAAPLRGLSFRGVAGGGAWWFSAGSVAAAPTLFG